MHSPSARTPTVHEPKPAMSWFGGFGWGSAAAEEPAPEEAAAKKGKRSHYDVLGVSEDADDGELKRAYRAKALEFHPDKNVGREEAASEEFKAVQAAFEVLSDPHERAYYDAHYDEATEATATDIVGHFSSAAYDGFGDGERSFYNVYTALFEELWQEEIVASGRERRLDASPPFGDADAAWETMKAFYAHWEAFNSVKTFAFADKHNLAEAPNREWRRAMEKENKRERAKEKKKFNGTVKDLVGFVKKRDPRVKARRVKEEEMRQEREEARLVEEKKEAEERKLRQKEAKAAREDAMEEDAEALDEILRNIKLDEEIERKRKKKGKKEDAGSDTDGDDEQDASEGEEGEMDGEAEAEVETGEDYLYCAVCKKRFRTRAQAANHYKSKKHHAAVRALRRQIWKEDAMFLGKEEGADGTAEEEVDEEEVAVPALSKKQKKKAKKLHQQREALMKQESESDGDAEEEAEPDVLDKEDAVPEAMPTLSKKQKKKLAKKKHQEALINGASVADADDAEEPLAEAVPVLSKKQKKKLAKKKQQQQASMNGNTESDADEGETAAAPARTTEAAGGARKAGKAAEGSAQKKPMTKKQKRLERERRLAEEKNAGMTAS